MLGVGRFDAKRLGSIDAFLHARYLNIGKLHHAQLLVGHDGEVVHFAHQRQARPDSPAVDDRTIFRIARNHLPGHTDLASMSQSLFSEAANAGTGFGLGFAINQDVARSMIPGSEREFYWDGMFSTAFFVDPVKRISCVFMTQLSPSNLYPIRRGIKTMIYAALT